MEVLDDSRIQSAETDGTAVAGDSRPLRPVAALEGSQARVEISRSNEAGWLKAQA